MLWTQRYLLQKSVELPILRGVIEQGILWNNVMRRKILFFELNEVPYRVMDEYCRNHPESFLARTLDKCGQFETRTEDTKLSPWITWPTVHRGVLDTQHTIHYFGQHLERVDDQFPPIWKILTDHGVRTGVFGSLHSYPVPRNLEHYAFFLPDTFAPSGESFPEQLATFQELNLVMARRSARNVSTAIPIKEAARFLANMPWLGLCAHTMLATAGQLLAERVDPWRRVRRRTYQAVLTFDVFMKQVQSTRPEFATFYTNHVASAMHRYWAAAFPQDYDRLEFDAEWLSRFKHEIDFAMQWFDRFFERLVRFADSSPDYSVWIATSMGQAARQAVPMYTQLYFTDLRRFMSTLGFGATQWERRPAMEPQVSVHITAEHADRFGALVRGMRINGGPIDVKERESGFFCISLGNPNLKGVVDSALVDGREVPFSDLGMESVPIEDRANGSAQHVRDGLLMIYGAGAPKAPQKRPVLSTLEIAPSILRNFRIDVPGYMASGAIEA